MTEIKEGQSGQFKLSKIEKLVAFGFWSAENNTRGTGTVLKEEEKGRIKKEEREI